MQDSGDSLWPALAETWLAVSLGAITTAEALQKVAHALDALGDTPCVVERDGIGGPIASDRAADAILKRTPRIDFVLKSSDGEPLGHLSLFAPPAELAVDRVSAFVSLVAGQHHLEAKRQMILHEINNRIAALLANVDYVEVLVDGATLDAPPLRNATPEQVRDFLAAIGNVGETTRALAQLARRKRP
jgi:hypothetical protein